MVFKKSVLIVTAALTAYLPTVSVSMERDGKDDAWFKKTAEKMEREKPQTDAWFKQAGERMEREKPQTDAWFKQAGERMKTDPFFQTKPALQSFASPYSRNNNSPSNSGFALPQPVGFGGGSNSAFGSNPAYGVGSSFNSQQPFSNINSMHNGGSPFSSQSREQEARRRIEQERRQKEDLQRQVEQEARRENERQRQVEQEARQKKEMSPQERLRQEEQERQLRLQESRSRLLVLDEEERQLKEARQRKIDEEIRQIEEARRQEEEKGHSNKEKIVSEQSNIESKPVQLKGEQTSEPSIERVDEEDEIVVDGHTLYWVNGNLYGATDQDQIDVGEILKKAGHQCQFKMLEAIKAEKKYDSDEQIIAILKALLIWDNSIKK